MTPCGFSTTPPTTRILYDHAFLGAAGAAAVTARYAAVSWQEKRLRGYLEGNPNKYVTME